MVGRLVWKFYITYILFALPYCAMACVFQYLAKPLGRQRRRVNESCLKTKRNFRVRDDKSTKFTIALACTLFSPLLARYLLYILPNISMNLNTYFELYRMFDEHWWSRYALSLFVSYQWHRMHRLYVVTECRRRCISINYAIIDGLVLSLRSYKHHQR